jgi:hypothetical protein
MLNILMTGIVQAFVGAGTVATIAPIYNISECAGMKT